MRTDGIPVIRFNSGAQELPVRIHPLTCATDDSDVRATAHRHDHFLIYFIRSGTGIHRIDLDQFTIEPGTIYFIAPGQLHLFEPGPDTDGLAVAFTDEFFCISESNKELLYSTNLFVTYSSKHPYKIPDEKLVYINGIFTHLEIELADKELLMQDMVRSLLKMIIIYATRENNRLYGTEPESSGAHLFRRFARLLDAHFTTKRQVSDYAAMLVLTPNHLNERLKQLTGKSASEHIRERVVLEAKRYAYYTDATLKEAAHYLGFEDEAHFSRYFSKETGYTFSAFRKNLSTVYGTVRNMLPLDSKASG